MFPPPSVLLFVLAGIAYLVAVRLSRWRAFNRVHRQFFAKYEAGQLTPEDAQVITHLSMAWDMPLIMEYALEFALFKTFAIPTISEILVSTNQMGGRMATKRYMDTKILIASWALCPLSGISSYSPPAGKASATDPRANIAIARTNFLHSKYPISNDDMLYTLSLFVSEPARFSDEYGWRPLSAMERQAFFLFWREIGQRMNISDIPDTMDGLFEWAKAYEDEKMVPAVTNELIATPNIEVLISILPSIFGIRNVARRLTIALLPERVRLAMLQPAQPSYIHTLLAVAINSFILLERHFLLPRRKPFQFIERDVWNLPNQCPMREQCTVFQAEPWYKPCPKTIIERLVNQFEVAIGRYTEMPSERLMSAGYVLNEVGPARWEKEGQEAVFKQAQELLGRELPVPWRK